MSSDKSLQIKNAIVSVLQSKPPIQALPPVARTILNRVIDTVISDNSSKFSNNIDNSINKSLNEIPLNLIGPNNPVDLVTGNLSADNLKDSINTNLGDSLSNSLSDEITNQILTKFLGEVPTIVKATIDINQLQNTLLEGSKSGVTTSIDNNLNSFSSDLLTNKILQPPSVDKVGDFYKRLGVQSGLEEVNKQFDQSAVNDAVDESKNFDTENNDNQDKLQSQTVGFLDTSSTFPDNEYSGRTETNKLATGDINGTIVQEKTTDRILGVRLPDNESFDQPDNPYNSEYPYNKVIQSESGHIVELDDTPGSERIHIFHKTGSFIEIDQTGSIVKRTKGS